MIHEGPLGIAASVLLGVVLLALAIRHGYREARADRMLRAMQDLSAASQRVAYVFNTQALAYRELIAPTHLAVQTLERWKLEYLVQCRAGLMVTDSRGLTIPPSSA